MKDFKTLKRNIKRKKEMERIIKVSLLGDSATQFLATAIIGEGVERGYNIDLFEAEYSQIQRQIFDLNSELYAHNSKYTIVFQSTHKLLEHYSLRKESEWEMIAEDRISFIKQICETIKGNLIVFNYPEIDDGVFGSYSNKITASFIYQIRELNYKLMKLSQDYKNLLICDIAALQNKFGRDFFFDSSVYVNTEMLLSINSLPYVASRILDIIDAYEGHFRKCLILDLDNTIWGGIVGDDGWENIQIGHGLGIGKVYTEIQEWIKRLKNRGVIICICSKNDEKIAKEPFIKNPEMVLKLEDISVFIANWNNKADNIRTIQKILNIGFDSMVFIDDNPFERNLVRENIPDIIVPELPEEPEKYLEYIYGENLFETSSFSSNDIERTKQYQTEAKRVATALQYTNESDFLKSLKMESEVSTFLPFNIPRVAQLSQRSNQFNLRTIRYTEDQVKEIAHNPKKHGFAFTLSDKFGENGLIAVVIMVECDSNDRDIPVNVLNSSKTLFIDTWFMSCRVLKRGMEDFTLNEIVEWAKSEGYKRLIGEYIPTKKNEMVKDFYQKLGFIKDNNTQNNQWILDLDKYCTRDCWISKKEIKNG